MAKKSKAKPTRSKAKAKTPKAKPMEKTEPAARTQSFVTTAPQAPPKKPTLETVKADAKDIAFWSTVTIDRKDEAAFGKTVSDGEYLTIKRADIPEIPWQVHMKAHREYTNTGAKLQDEPEICGLYRDNNDGLSLLVGYKAP